MFTQIIFIFFPLLFALHAIEERIIQRRWTDKHGERLQKEFAQYKNLKLIVCKTSTGRLALIVLEEFIILLIADYLFMSYRYWPLAAVFWAFIFHLIQHISFLFVLRQYVPGGITAILLLPLVTIGGSDLYLHYTLLQNIALFIGGFLFMMGNHLLMQYLVKRKEK